MKQDELDRALSVEIPLVPSPGFASGVMAAVHREASLPCPIPFPWKRALPGLVTGLLTLVAMIVAAVKNVSHPASPATIQRRLIPALANAASFANEYGINWILLAMAITLACVILSMRLAAGRKRTV